MFGRSRFVYSMLVVSILIFIRESESCDNFDKCSSNYQNRIITGPGVQPVANVDSLESCASLCTAGCSAYSFNDCDGLCVVTYCGSLLVKTASNWVTVITNHPLTVGVTLPAATHDWPLTINCGYQSMGIYNKPPIIAPGTSYNYILSPFYGKTLYFPNNNNMQGFNARTGVSQSIADYSKPDSSMTVSFYLYLTTVPAKVNLFEFTGGQVTTLWWIWPDNTKLHANLNNPNEPQTVTIDRSWSPKTWYHMAFVYDADAVSLKQYINSTLIDERYWTKQGRLAFNRMVFGGRAPEFANNDMGYFNGGFFCLKLHNIALTATEISNVQRSCLEGSVTFLG